MDSLKNKIVEKLEYLPEVALQEVLDFVNFLERRKTNVQEPSSSVANDDSWEEDDAAWIESDISRLGSYEPYDWQLGEIDEGLPVEHISGVGVVIVEE